MPVAHARDGHPIHYRSFEPGGAAAGRGDSPTAVLIQGLGLSGQFWFDTPSDLAARDRDPYRTLVPDNRGTGETPIPGRPFPIGTMADDVIAMLDAEGIDRAFVVGISMGGMIAQQVALRHPDRVAGLVLLATTPGLPVGRLPRPEIIRVLVGSALNKPKDLTPLARLLLPPSEMDRMHEHLARWPDALRARPTQPRAFGLQLGAIATHAAAPRLSRVRCPTHVATGTEDVLLPPKNSELIAARIPGATLELIPGVAHSVPTLVPDIVERSLDRVRARA